MNLLLKREQLAPDFTIGSLSIDGQFVAWTCEDQVRPPGAPKVYGKTAIPAGRYRIVITPSNRFKRDLPLLLGVPGFEGIRIHPGNKAVDTDGCVLPGLKRGPDGVLESRLAFEQIFPQIVAGLKVGQVFIDIE